MSVAIGSKLHMNLHIIVCLCQFVYSLHQYILNYGSLVIFTVAIFLQFKMATSYHVGSNYVSYETICHKVCVPIFVLLPYIYAEICRIIDIEDGHFKIQDGGQVCQYQLHMNPCNHKVFCANVGSVYLL